MEFEFDKEIDAILRKARVGEAVASFDSHLDADEISAFTENALPELARARFASHFADCTRCRKILSNVIALNSEAAVETASSLVPAKIVEAKTPWYRKLFVFPQLAYTMGALVVLFSGFLGFLILQNLTGSKNSEVSYSANKTASAEKPASQTNPTVFSSSNAVATNSTTTTTTNSTTTTTNTTVTTSSTPVYSSNTAANGAPEKKSAVPESKSATTADQTSPVMNEKPQDKANSETERDELSKKKSDSPVGGAVSGTVRQADKQAQTDDAVRSKDEKNKIKEETPEPKLSKPSPMPKSARKTESLAGEKRSVSGKTFNNVGGIWFDSAYSNQKQKIVNRGTNDYQKLDSGLRSIADQFSGTVVVLWKSKAYRIQ